MFHPVIAWAGGTVDLNTKDEIGVVIVLLTLVVGALLWLLERLKVFPDGWLQTFMRWDAAQDEWFRQWWKARRERREQKRRRDAIQEERFRQWRKARRGRREEKRRRRRGAPH